MQKDDNTTIRSFALSEVLKSIESVLKKTYVKPYWIRCEISRISIHNQTGHCYMELVEKNERGIVAQVRAMAWADYYPVISKKFESVTGNVPGNGMQVMLLCSISFHPVHGLSLMVTDIEPSFTLGELARLKNEAIAKLKAEGLIELNKKIKLSVLPGRLAIISVDTSRGFQDFVQTIQSFPKKYNISWLLFEAILQGENAVSTISAAIRRILARQNEFDAIAIIRGGAGETGLSCYDDFSLAKLIAECPLPVLTGIGHATNETVVEMVAHKSFITPTAAAQFLLSAFEQEEIKINSLQQVLLDDTTIFFQKSKNELSASAERFNMGVRSAVNNEQLVLKNSSDKIKMLSSHLLSILGNSLKEFARELKFKSSGIYFSSKQQQFYHSSEKLKLLVTQFITNQKSQLATAVYVLPLSLKYVTDQQRMLNHTEEKVSLMSPAETLKRGYSITRKNGIAVTNANKLAAGDAIEIEFAEGKITTTV